MVREVSPGSQGVEMNLFYFWVILESCLESVASEPEGLVNWLSVIITLEHLGSSFSPKNSKKLEFNIKTNGHNIENNGHIHTAGLQFGPRNRDKEEFQKISSLYFSVFSHSLLTILY